MARDDFVGVGDQDRIGETKSFDAVGDLFDLFVGMGAGIAGIGSELRNR